MPGIAVFKSLNPDSKETFELSIVNHDSIEDVANWLKEAGAENDQKVIDFIKLDDSDLAIGAITNVLFLAVDADSVPGNSTCPAEVLLKRIFLAGYKASEEMFRENMTLFHVWVRQVPGQTL